MSQFFMVCIGFKQENIVKVAGWMVGLSLLAVCVSTSAYDVGMRSSKRDVVTKSVEKKVIATPKYSTTQILCIKKLRTGSRVAQNKCQTLAQWKQEFDEQAMRQYLIKPRGQAASWELSP